MFCRESLRTPKGEQKNRRTRCLKALFSYRISFRRVSLSCSEINACLSYQPVGSINASFTSASARLLDTILLSMSHVQLIFRCAYRKNYVGAMAAAAGDFWSSDDYLLLTAQRNFIRTMGMSPLWIEWEKMNFSLKKTFTDRIESPNVGKLRATSTRFDNVVRM